MGLPIALGATTVSCHELTTSRPMEEFTNDGIILVPVASPRGVDPTQQLSVSIATSGGKFLALLNVSYYDLLRLDNGDCDHTSAELKIQISPLAEALSSQYKETIHKVCLPCTGEKDRIRQKLTICLDSENTRIPNSPPISCSMMFSSDHRFLTCLIPHMPPNGTRVPESIALSSSVVVFQLRTPTLARQPIDYPDIPSYIRESQSAIDNQVSTTICPVATNPKLILSPGSVVEDSNPESKKPLLDVCSMCDARVTCTETGPSLLFLGTRNGSIVATSYRNIIDTNVVYRSCENPVSIISMDHITLWKKEETLEGKLVTVCVDGTIHLFRSEIRLEKYHTSTGSDCNVGHSAATSFLFSAKAQLSTKVHLEDIYVFVSLATTHVVVPSNALYYNSVKLISASNLAMASKPSMETITAQVIGLYDNGQSGTISSIEMTVDDVLENSHATYSLVDDWSKSNRNQLSSPKRQYLDSAARRIDQNVRLEYDPITDCIAISGNLTSSTKEDENIHFGTIWHWRTNSQGLIVGPTKSYVSSQSVKIRTNKLCFATDTSHISHVLVYDTSSGKYKLRKDLYTIGILSPPHDSNNGGGVPKQSCSLLLSSETVAYPLVTRISTQANAEVEWRESMLPRSYIVTYGYPRIGAIGGRGGRSVAIASSRGFCVLDCVARSSTNVKQVATSYHPGIENGNTLMKQLLKPSIAKPRWNLFGNIGTERSFRVIAMAFWEPFSFEGSDTAPMVTDDLIVALIEVDDEESPGIFVACWSSRNLSLNGQLLVDRTTERCKWGIAMPAGFTPMSLDVLSIPERNDEVTFPIQRKASVLLFDNSFETNFAIYHLFATTSDTSSLRVGGKGGKPYEIFCRHGVSSSIGSPAHLFIASTSFSFDIIESLTVNSELVHTSVIGVFKEIGGGLHAIEVADKKIVSSGWVLRSACDSGSTDFSKGEICRFYQGESSHRYPISDNNSMFQSFDWIFQLADGCLVCWSVPSCLLSNAAQGRRRESLAVRERTYVNNRHLSLGFITDVGTVSSWFQQPSKGTRSDFLLGCMPELSFGYVLGVGQSCKRLRSYANELSCNTESIETEILCPGDIVLYPPACLTAAYAYCVDTIATMNFANPDFFQNLLPRIGKDLHRHSSMMCLQLLILRSTEMLANTKDANKGLLMIQCLLVDAVRRNATSLEFAAFFVQLGRQLEPNYMSVLFPLPILNLGNIGYGETVSDIFEMILRQGSISTAVTALPLYADMQSTQALCSAVFFLCLDVLLNLLDVEEPSLFVTLHEFKNTARDVFSYSLKLNGSTRAVECGSEQDVDELPASSYSIFCGLPRFWTRSSSQGKDTQGVSDKPIQIVNRLPSTNNDTLQSFNAAVITSKFVESLIDEGSFDKHCVWKKGARIASILLDGKSNGLARCSKDEFTNLVRIAAEDKDMDRHLRLLKKYMIECEMQLSQYDAEIILELCLVLLSTEESENINVTSLLIVSIVTGHVSDRVTDIISVEPSVNRIWTAYLNARFELSL